MPFREFFDRMSKKGYSFWTSYTKSAIVWERSGIPFSIKENCDNSSMYDYYIDGISKYGTLRIIFSHSIYLIFVHKIKMHQHVVVSVGWFRIRTKISARNLHSIYLFLNPEHLNLDLCI